MADRTEDDWLRALDTYLGALHHLPHAACARNAIGHCALPDVEIFMAGDLAQLAHEGTLPEDPQTWLAWYVGLAEHPTRLRAPHADAPDRLAQAVATLREAGLWPWT